MPDVVEVLGKIIFRDEHPALALQLRRDILNSVMCSYVIPVCVGSGAHANTVFLQQLIVNDA